MGLCFKLVGDCVTNYLWLIASFEKQTLFCLARDTLDVACMYFIARLSGVSTNYSYGPLTADFSMACSSFSSIHPSLRSTVVVPVSFALSLILSFRAFLSV